MTFTLIFLSIFIASAVICHFLAKKYDASPAFWGTMGLLFGPFAIMLLAYLSKKLRNNYKI
jgi:tellurite resistance protein TehA-like permease